MTTFRGTRAAVAMCRDVGYEARDAVARPQRGGVVSDYERYQGTRQFGSLDGLRTLSIIGVLWHHTTPRAPDPLRVFGRGFMGVDLFFVISGFLIVTLLLRERRKTGTISLSGFYARRSLRIFPPFYLMLALVAGVELVHPGNGAAAIWHDMPYAALYVANFVSMQSLLAITWSLAAEEQFYLVAPAALRAMPRAFPRVVLPILYVFLSALPFGLFPWLPVPGFFRETTFGPILLGVMLAHVLDDPRGYAWARRLLGWRGAPLATAAILFLALCHPTPDITGWPRIFIHWSMVLLVASCVVREDHALVPLLSLWPVRRIGAVSYGIYLFHHLVFWGVEIVLRRLSIANDYVFFVAVTVGTWIVAELSYRIYEVRFLALKSRFEPGHTPAKVAAVEASPTA